MRKEDKIQQLHFLLDFLLNLFRGQSTRKWKWPPQGWVGFVLFPTKNDLNDDDDFDQIFFKRRNHVPVGKLLSKLLNVKLWLRPC